MRKFALVLAAVVGLGTPACGRKGSTAPLTEGSECYYGDQLNQCGTGLFCEPRYRPDGTLERTRVKHDETVAVGTCRPKAGAGRACTMNEGCEAGLECHFATGGAKTGTCTAPGS